MEKMTDLQDLLKHEIQDLYSVEEQIIAAMPDMIEKATNQQLKSSLKEHLRITERQKARVAEVLNALGEEIENEETGLFDRLFKTKMVCKGMQGIIEEGQKILKEDMNTEVRDAAIIACAQKIEHYEICGYGTAKAYARELNMPDIEGVLDEILNEEYDADDRLTALAVGRLNRQAENADETSSRGRSNSSGGRSGSTERTPVREMELETASDSSSRGRRSSESGTDSSRGSSAPRGNSRSGSSSGRSSSASGTPKSSASRGSSSGSSRSSASGSKSSSARGGSSSGRSSSTGRSNGRKK